MEIVRYKGSFYSLYLLRNDERVFNLWVKSISNICEDGLAQPLLIRIQTTGLFKVNFDPSVR